MLIKLRDSPYLYRTFANEKEWENYTTELSNGTPRRQPLCEPESFPCIWIISNSHFYNPDGPDYEMGAFLYGTIEYEDED